MENVGHSCPNCGAALDWRLRLTRLVECAQCGAAVALERDGALRQIGERGDMADTPALFRVGEVTEALGRPWRALGHVRFSYGPGWWDEFWCVFDGGGARADEDALARAETAWFSCDEGDVAMEAALGPDDPAPPAEPGDSSDAMFSWPPQSDNLKWPQQTYALTETGEARCIAFRGELPEAVALGETHRYRLFASQKGGLMTLETWRDGAGRAQESWSAGRWIDPWEVTAPQSDHP
ncbi:MAG: DUF4178 domain-containing protein [Pseudomonadota bacterium]